MEHGITEDISALESFGFIADVAVPLLAELDHRTISFHELLSLDLDSLILLSRPSGENIDLYVGDVLLGSGEMLVTGTTLAVRVAELRDKPAVDPGGPSIPQRTSKQFVGGASGREGNS